MKRFLMFLVAAPVSVAVASWLTFVLIEGFAERRDANLVATVLFIFTLPVSAVTGALDEILARAFPILLRLPMTVAIGAIGASGLAFILFSKLLGPEILPVFAAGGAACAGLCSLLANDYGGTPLVSIHRNSLLRNR